MPTFKPTIYVEQLMRTKPTIKKITDISRNEKSSNFYLHSYLVWQGTKTALLKKTSGNILLICQAIPKWIPAYHREYLWIEFLLPSFAKESSRVLSTWFSHFWHIFSWDPSKNRNNPSITPPQNTQPQNKNKITLDIIIIRDYG